MHLRLSFPEIKDFPLFAASLGKNEYSALEIRFQVSWLKFSAHSSSLVTAHKKSTACFCCRISEFSEINEFEETVGLIWPSSYLT